MPSPPAVASTTGAAATGTVGAAPGCDGIRTGSWIRRKHRLGDAIGILIDGLDAQRQPNQILGHAEDGPLALWKARSPAGSRMMSSNKPEPAAVSPARCRIPGW